MRTGVRKATLLNAVVQITAAAIAIVGTLFLYDDILQRSTASVPSGVRFPLVTHLQWWMTIPIPSLIAFTVAHLILRLRQPRLSLRELSCYADTVASALVVTFFGVQLVLVALAFGLKQVPGMASTRSILLLPSWWVIVRQSTDAGLVVLGAWLVLGWSRHWRADASWLDRMGRTLGACWVGLFLAQRTAMLIMMME